MYANNQILLSKINQKKGTGPDRRLREDIIASKPFKLN